MTYNGTERCGCGATITVDAYTTADVRKALDEFRGTHQHIVPFLARNEPPPRRDIFGERPAGLGWAPSDDDELGTRFTGYVEDAGGGQVKILVDRGTANYPAVGEHVVVNGEPVDRETLVGMAESLWLHVNWRDLTMQMTTPQKELLADLVDEAHADDDSDPVDRWWR